MMNTIKTEFQSMLRLKKIFVSKTEFCQADELKPEVDILFEFENEVSDIDEKNFKVVLTGNLESEDKSIRASASVVAFFEFGNEIKDSGIIDSMKNANAVAIMFPYLRTQLSLVSSQSEATLNLPAINIAAYFDDKRKKSI